MDPNNIKRPVANKNNVLSNKNKEFLWNVLYENNCFGFYQAQTQTKQCINLINTKLPP